MANAAKIFAFLKDAADRGERTALVTLTAVIGSSSRAPGTHMAVSETGASAGSFSGGCVEAAVVAEAREVMAEGKGRLTRFGAGSRYLDIRLPCGGGIDLLFTPEPSRGAVDEAIATLAARRPATLLLGCDGSMALTDDALPSGWRGDNFVFRHDPNLRVLIVGHGAETPALARLATTYGADVTVLTPDRALRDALRSDSIAAHELVTPAPSPYLVSDPYTAIIFLFHDHDWEPQLLAQALAQEAFFIGAMGSRSTHDRRRQSLVEVGVSDEAVSRVVAPVGIIPATRDPQTLALSVLGQIVERHQRVRARIPAAAPFMNRAHETMS